MGQSATRSSRRRALSALDRLPMWAAVLTGLAVPLAVTLVVTATRIHGHPGQPPPVADATISHPAPPVPTYPGGTFTVRLTFPLRGGHWRSYVAFDRTRGMLFVPKIAGSAMRQTGRTSFSGGGVRVRATYCDPIRGGLPRARLCIWGRGRGTVTIAYGQPVNPVRR
jgi:hypothetical protein